MRAILDAKAIALLREHRIYFEADPNELRLRPGQAVQFFREDDR